MKKILDELFSGSEFSDLGDNTFLFSKGGKTMRETFKVTTEKGKELDVREGDYEGEPTIIFGEVSSYLFETFLEIPGGEGLCLEGNKWNYHSIDAETVAKCKKWIGHANEVITEATGSNL